MLDLIEAQAKRIDTQATEIKDLWTQVKDLHREKLLAEDKSSELCKKYSQLDLEAQLGLKKVVIVVGAIAFMLGLTLHELPDVLKALPRIRPQPTAAAVKAPDGSHPATPVSKVAP